MNTRIALYATLIYLLVGGSNTLFAQSPYETSWKKNGIIGGACVITALVGSAVDNSVPPLTLQQIQALSRDDINWFDRSATYNWSERARKASDALVVTSFVVPLSLFLLDDIRSDWGTITTMYMETFVFAAFVPSSATNPALTSQPT